MQSWLKMIEFVVYVIQRITIITINAHIFVLMLLMQIQYQMKMKTKHGQQSIHISRHIAHMRYLVHSQVLILHIIYFKHSFKITNLQLQLSFFFFLKVNVNETNGALGWLNQPCGRARSFTGMGFMQSQDNSSLTCNTVSVKMSLLCLGMSGGSLLLWSDHKLHHRLKREFV